MVKLPIFCLRTCRLGLRLFLAALIAQAGTAAYGQTPKPDEPIALVAHTTVEKTLAGGQLHAYQIRLEAGQFFEAKAEQKGVNVAVRVMDETGKVLFEEDRIFGIYEGAEPIVLIAETAGRYRLEIAAVEPQAEAGRYAIRTETPRFPAPADQLRVRAEALFREGFFLSNHIRSTRDRSAVTKAVALFNESITLWQALGNQLREREALCRIGAIHLPFGEILLAQEAYERALGLLAGSDGLTAFDLNNLGFLYNRLGDSQKALYYYQQSLPLRRLNRDRWSEGVTLDNMGQVYRRQGDLYQALEHHLKALQLFRELRRQGSESIALSNIANVHYQLGELEKAIEYAQQALVIKEAEDNSQTGLLLHNLGTYHLAGGKPNEALTFLNRALAVDQQTGNTFNEAYDLGTLGKIHAALQEPAKALAFFEQAMTLHRKVGNRLGIAQTLNGMGLAHDQLGDLPKAIAAYEEALESYRQFGNPEQESESLNALAGLHRKQGNWALARQQMEEAIALAESVRARAQNQRFRSSYLARKQSIYDAYTDLLMDMHKLEPGRGYELIALQNSERTRARSLLESLAEARADIRKGADPALLVEENRLRQQLNAKGQEQNRLFSLPANPQSAALLAREIENLTAQLQQIEARLRASSPRYAALTQPQPLTAVEVQQLLDEDTVLLEYTLGEEQSWLWAVTRTSLSAQRLPPRREIETAARNLYHHLTARQPKPGESEAAWRARVFEADAKFSREVLALSRLLLSPIAEPLAEQWQGKRLLIIAPGALQYLPFGALTVPWEEGGLQPIITRHEIVNLPSASVLSLIRQEIAGRRVAAKAVAVLADPVFEANDPRVAMAKKRIGGGREIALQVRSESAGETGKPAVLRALRGFDTRTERAGLSRLPFSREEAEAIASLVPAKSLLKATDFQANHTRVLNGELSDFRIIHFATHGLLNSKYPELSGLVLSLIDEQGRGQDGFLRMHQIYNLDLPAEVVVLSACQTALGQEIKGEGLIGLTRGFMYAGAQRVVASLWQVDDLATAELMKHFYRGMLKDNLRPAAALRAAQLELMKEKRWSSPFFWAAFVIQGEWK